MFFQHALPTLPTLISCLAQDEDEINVFLQSGERALQLSIWQERNIRVNFINSGIGLLLVPKGWV